MDFGKDKSFVNEDECSFEEVTSSCDGNSECVSEKTREENGSYKSTIPEEFIEGPIVLPEYEVEDHNNCCEAGSEAGSFSEFSGHNDAFSDHHEQESEAVGTSNANSEEFSTAESQPTIADSIETLSHLGTLGLSEDSRLKAQGDEVYPKFDKEVKIYCDPQEGHSAAESPRSNPSNVSDDDIKSRLLRLNTEAAQGEELFIRREAMQEACNGNMSNAARLGAQADKLRKRIETMSSTPPKLAFYRKCSENDRPLHYVPIENNDRCRCCILQ